MELVALDPSGPFRLIVDHPAKRLVEYFTSSREALCRWNQIESALRGPYRFNETQGADGGLLPAA